MELYVSNARLRDGRLVGIGIDDGRIVSMSDGPAPADPLIAIDADGGLVTEPFVNAHLHLDKVHTVSLAGDAAITAYTADNMSEAAHSIDLAREVKRDYDLSWLIPNIRRALVEAVRHGTLHILAFADVDTTAGLTGVAAVLEVREEFRDLLDIQVVAFPQDGIVRDPGAAELCEQAMELGADVVGGIPWIESTDADAEAHVEWACALAARLGTRVAMLTDDAGDPTLHTTRMLAEAMLRHGLHGRGVACHARALALYPETELADLMALAARAGLGFVSDPHTGPLALPVERFDAAGLPVALGQDDISDAYYPYGRNNLLEVAFLSSHLLDLRTAPQRDRLIDFVTTSAARVLGLDGYGMRVGGRADLCVHGARTTVDLLRSHDAPQWVIHSGRIAAQTVARTAFGGPIAW